MMAFNESTVEDQCFQANGHGLSPQRTFTPTDEGLQNMTSFLEQHPWSVSDPGLASSRVVERSPREWISLPHLKRGFEAQTQLDTSPLIERGFQVEQQDRNQGNNHGFLVATSNNLVYILKTIRSRTVGNKEFLKWVFIWLNVLVELCQAAFSQVKNEGKMGSKVYLRLSIVTSSICLMMALIETFYEVKRCGVVWQKRGHCCWLYYPGNEGRLFGRFSLYFGLISSTVQLMINLTEKLINKKDFVKFDYMPLLLAVCYLVAAIIASREKTSSSTLSIRCSVHGLSDVEGTAIEGHESRVFQCPQCLMEEYLVRNRC